MAAHLPEGGVAVLEEIGSEKLRYLVGEAVAVDHRGETLRISIADIYEKIREAGWAEHPSIAAY